MIDSSPHDAHQPASRSAGISASSDEHAMSTPDQAKPMRVGLLGWGAIGSEVGKALRRGDVSGVELTAVAALRHHDDLEVPQVAPSDLADHFDLVVEAAGQAALSEHGPGLLAAGVDLLVLSVGAFGDAELFDRLTHGPAAASSSAPARSAASTSSPPATDWAASRTFTW